MITPLFRSLVPKQYGMHKPPLRAGDMLLKKCTSCATAWDKRWSGLYCFGPRLLVDDMLYDGTVQMSDIADHVYLGGQRPNYFIFRVLVVFAESLGHVVYISAYFA